MSKPYKKLVIVNSVSNWVKKHTDPEVLKKFFQKNLPDADVFFTEYKGHAYDICRRTHNYDVYIGAGGDGTIHEIINSINLDEKIIGILPFGSGNSLARDLNIWSVTDGAEILKKSQISELPILECKIHYKNKEPETKFAFSTTGIGYLPDVVALAKKYLTGFGKMAYPISTCLKLFKQKRIIASRIFIDDQDTFSNKKFTMFTVNNTKYAGNFCIFPEENVFENKMSYLCFEATFLEQFISNMTGLLKKYFYYPETPQRFSKISIKMEKPELFMIDGELIENVMGVDYKFRTEKIKVIC